jgi:Flp pilus assembly protein TadD
VPTPGELVTQGLNALAQGRLDDALSAFESVLAVEPGSDVAWMGISIVHERRQELDQAIAAIRKAIELKPDEPLHYTSLSRYYQSKGMIPEAEEAMARSYRMQGGR